MTSTADLEQQQPLHDGYDAIEERAPSPAASSSYRAVSPYPSVDTAEAPPILEIPEEIYAVRKAALQVLKPLTKTWVSSQGD